MPDSLSTTWIACLTSTPPTTHIKVKIVPTCDSPHVLPAIYLLIIKVFSRAFIIVNIRISLEIPVILFCYLADLTKVCLTTRSISSIFLRLNKDFFPIQYFYPISNIVEVAEVKALKFLMSNNFKERKNGDANSNISHSSYLMKTSPH